MDKTGDILCEAGAILDDFVGYFKHLDNYHILNRIPTKGQ